MTQVVLKPARIHSLIRKRVSASMPQHVDVYCKGKFSGRACSLDHPGKALPLKRITALIDEHIRALTLSREPLSLLMLIVRAASSMSSHRRSQASLTLSPCL
jgi:hypothetical protein